MMKANNGLIGAKSGHPIIKACVDQMTIGTGGPLLYSRILRNLGPDYLNSMFLDYYCDQWDDNRTVVFPQTFFYPSWRLRGPGLTQKSRWNLSGIKC